MATQSKIDIIVNLLFKTAGDVLKSTQKNLGSVKSAADSVSDSVFNLKNAFAGLGIGVVMQQAVSEFADFQDTMLAVKAVTRATSEEFDKLNAAAAKMGETTRFKASEAAEALQFLGMAGFDAAQATQALPGVLNLASAGAIDLGSAADIASNILTGYGAKVEELGRVNDILVQAFTNSNTSLTDLGVAFKYVGPTAKGFGVEMENTAAAMMALGNAGIQGSMAGTTLRGVLSRLTAPTKEASKLMTDLSERIGGAGLQIYNSEGSFIGFGRLIEQLEQAGLDADEALKLFGLRAGPGISAMLEQGSEALYEYEELLKNSDDRAKDVAETMESGLGGAIRTLGSAWESLKIALGAGFEGVVTESVQYFTELIRSAKTEIKRLQDEGTLTEWGEQLKDVFVRIVEVFKTFTQVLFSTADAFAPVIRVAIDLAPALVALALAAKTLSVSVGLATNAFTLFSAAAGSSFISSITGTLRFIQTASVQTGSLTTAILNMKNALAVAGAALAAFGVGFSLGTIINEMKLFEDGTKTVGEKIQEMLEVSGDAIKVQEENLAALLKSLSAYKDFKMPEDFAGSTVAEFDEINKQIRKSTLYWETYQRQVEMQADIAAKTLGKNSEAYRTWVAELETVKVKLAELTAAQESVDEAMTAGTKDLEERRKAHTKYLDEIAAQERKFTEEIKKGADEKLEAEELAYNKREGIYADDANAYNTYQDRKKAITTDAEAEIADIRLYYAEQIQENAKRELSTAQSLKDEKIKIINEEVEAGKKTRQDANTEIVAIEEKFSGERQRILETTGNAIANTEKKISEQRIDNFVNNIEAESAALQAGLDNRLAVVAEKEAEQTITASQAAKERQRINEEFFNKNKDDYVNAVDYAIRTYGQDSDQYKKTVEAKSEFDAQYSEFRIENAKKVSEESQALEEADMGMFEAQLKEKSAIIDANEQQGVISTLEATEQRAALEEEFNQKRLEDAVKTVNKLQELGDTESAEYKEALAKKLEIETEINMASIKAQKDRLDAVKSMISDETDARQSAHDVRIANIEAEEKFGIITAEEASDKKKEIEISFLKFKLDQTQKVLEAVRREYGEESEEYRKAAQAKKQAEAALQTEIANQYQEAEEKKKQITQEAAAAADERNKAFAEANRQREEQAVREAEERAQRYKEQQEAMAEAVKERTEQVRDSFMKMFDALEDASKEQLETIEDKIGAIDGALEDIEAPQFFTEDFGAGFFDDFQREIDETVDITGKSTAEMEEYFKGAYSKITDIGREKFEILKKYMQDVNVSWDFDKAMTAIEDFANIGGKSAKEIQENFKYAHEQILTQGTDKLRELQEEYSDLGSKIESVTNEIAETTISSEEKIRDIKRKTFTEEELWQDKRLEYAQLIAQAQELQEEGAFDDASMLYDKAIQIAADLSSGVTGWGDTDQIAIDLINAATESKKDLLTAQKEFLEQEQVTLLGDMDKTFQEIETFRLALEDIAKQQKVDLVVEKEKAEKDIATVQEMVDKLTGEKKIDIDVSDLSGEIEKISKEFARAGEAIIPENIEQLYSIGDKFELAGANFASSIEKASKTDFMEQFRMERAFEQEMRLEQDRFELEKKLTEKQIELLEEKRRLLEAGEPFELTVTGDKLQPHLKMLWQQIMEDIQVEVNSQGGLMLLGL